MSGYIRLSLIEKQVGKKMETAVDPEASFGVLSLGFKRA